MGKAFLAALVTFLASEWPELLAYYVNATPRLSLSLLVFEGCLQLNTINMTLRVSPLRVLFSYSHNTCISTCKLLLL